VVQQREDSSGSPREWPFLTEGSQELAVTFLGVGEHLGSEGPPVTNGLLVTEERKEQIMRAIALGGHAALVLIVDSNDHPAFAEGVWKTCAS
jgi:hypothetical protein